VQLEEIKRHHPMFKCAISAKDYRDEPKLEKALALLVKEDPSLVN